MQPSEIHKEDRSGIINSVPNCFQNTVKKEWMLLTKDSKMTYQRKLMNWLGPMNAAHLDIFCKNRDKENGNLPVMVKWLKWQEISFIYKVTQLILHHIWSSNLLSIFLRCDTRPYIWGILSEVDKIRGAFKCFQTFLYRHLKLSYSWKFTMLLLYILWDDWPIFMISASNEQLQRQLEYTLLKPDCHSWLISKMQSGCEDTLEERYAIKFCFKLGRNATETYGML